MPTLLTGKSDTGGGAWAKLDVGVYPATLTSFEKSPSAFEPDKERYQFNYELDGETNDDGTPVVMRYWANAVLSPRSSLAAIIEAHGFEWGVGVPFDLDDVVGTKARLMVGRKTPQGKTDEIAFVQSVVPVASKPAAAAAAAPAAKKAAPAQAAVGLLCGFPNCGRPAFSVDDEDGNPICPKHGGLPE